MARWVHEWREEEDPLSDLVMENVKLRGMELLLRHLVVLLRVCMYFVRMEMDQAAGFKYRLLEREKVMCHVFLCARGRKCNLG